MQAELIIPDTDLERFQAWMDEQAILLENAINSAENFGRVAPVLFGWDKRRFTCYYEFCTVTPTPGQVEMWRSHQGDGKELAALRKVAPPSDEELDDSAWVNAASNERFNAIDARGRIRYDGGTAWIYRPMDDNGQYRDKHVSAWIAAQEYRHGQLRVTFWRDDAQPGYDVLLDMLRKDFGIETAEPTPDPTPQAGGEAAPVVVEPEPASLKEIIVDAMEKHPSRQGISRQAWGLIFAWCDKHEGLKIDPAAIAQLAGAEKDTVRKALQRYREDQNDCHKT